MGCCLSSPATATTNTQTPKSNPAVFTPPRRHPHSPESDPDRRRAPPPPPPPLEEETVKEVLSETPIPKPFIPIANDNDRKRDPQQQQQQPPLVDEEAKIQPMAVIKPAEEIVSEVSEVSEIYSYSESLSTVTDKREEDGEVTQRVQRSPAAKVPRKRTERGIRSPARRSEPSPVKRNHITPRSVQGPPPTAKTAGVRRNVGPPNAVRRDAGEGSGRRSRSPVIRGDLGAGRPARSKSPTPSRTPTERTGSRLPVSTAENGEERGKGKEETLPESLENPLVSLECFIFL